MSDCENKNDLFHDEDEIACADSITSVPLLLSDKVKCDKFRNNFNETHTFWILRLTPENDNYRLSDVKELLSDLTTKDVWFVSEEQSKKAVKHYHTVFIHPNGLDPREEIKSWLVRLFPDKWKKQDGNKRYNLQPADDNNRDHKAFIYASKDGDYVYGDGVNPKYVEYVNSKSFQKVDTRVGQLMLSRSLYIKGEYDDKQLFESVCNVCIATSSTGSLNMTYVKSFITGAKAQKDPHYRDQLFKSLNL